MIACSGQRWLEEGQIFSEIKPIYISCEYDDGEGVERPVLNRLLSAISGIFSRKS